MDDDRLKERLVEYRMYEATKTGKVGGNAVLFALQGKGTVPSRLSLPSTPTVLAAPEMWPSRRMSALRPLKKIL
jgi:hypothetical protein